MQIIFKANLLYWTCSSVANPPAHILGTPVYLSRKFWVLYHIWDFFFFGDMVSLYSHGSPSIVYIDKASLTLKRIIYLCLPSTGAKGMYATMPSSSTTMKSKTLLSLNQLQCIGPPLKYTNNQF